MRLFIALDLENEESKNYFESIQKQINANSAKLTFTKSVHITLKFLGDVAEDKVESIKKRLFEIKFDKFTIKTNVVGCFPNTKSANIIWLGIKKNSTLAQLQKNIDSALNDFPADFKFHPHITLARVKYISDKNNFEDMIKKINPETIKFEINKFYLIKSTLTESGPVYDILEEY